MKKIAIFYGGKSAEFDVSCKSGLFIYQNIDRSRFEVLLIGVSKNGKWFLQDENSVLENSLKVVENGDKEVYVLPERGFFSAGKNLSIDFAFPIIHGTNGEDGSLQGVFEIANIAYAGSGVIGSAVGMDKELVKRIWQNENLPVVPFLTLKSFEYDNTKKDLIIKKIETKFDYPIFIKPVNAGSSVGVTKAHNREELLSGIETAFNFDKKILIEKFIDAREIECAIIGNEDIKVFYPAEITPQHEFYDFEAKYLDSNGASLDIKTDLDKSMVDKILSTAKKAYLLAEIKGFCRLDFFVDKNSGDFYINEVNTLPGFTPISMFPKICENSGIEIKELLSTLIDLGFKEFKKKSKFQFLS